jgi:hypothetical protein
MPSKALVSQLRGWTAILCPFLLSFTLSAKDFVKPAAQPARSYPAHDDHPNEKVAMAADPYDTPQKARVFSIEFNNYGFLPVFFVVTNDSDQPISIANIVIQLITPNRSKFTPVSSDDIYRRLSHPQANTNSPIPFPIPHKRVKGTVTQKEKDEIDAAQFEARGVEPHTTQAGFLFFDVSGLSTPLAGSHIDITGVDDAKGNELMYFEIPLEKYLNSRKSPN